MRPGYFRSRLPGGFAMTVVGERRDVLERIGLNPKYIDTISEQLAQSIENVVDEVGARAPCRGTATRP